MPVCLQTYYRRKIKAVFRLVKCVPATLQGEVTTSFILTCNVTSLSERKMNWVGGARNRIKLKHEKKLQKEFFERKRQLKSSFRIAPPKKVHKKHLNSQDLLSLEVIMSVHKNDSTPRKGAKDSSLQNSDKENTSLKGVSTETLQHILPEMSPVRELPRNLTEDEIRSCCESQTRGECIFSQTPSHRSPFETIEEVARSQSSLDEEDPEPWQVFIEHRAAENEFEL